MSQNYYYTVNLFLQGTEVNTLSIEADSPKMADDIIYTAIKENQISSLIDDCLSSETEIDYSSVRFLTPEQAGGRETVSVYRDGHCIFTNHPETSTTEDVNLTDIDKT